MAYVKVVAYYADWNLLTNSGSVQVNLENNNGSAVSVSSPEELSLLLDILRNESLVFCDSVSGWLQAGPAAEGHG